MNRLLVVSRVTVSTEKHGPPLLLQRAWQPSAFLGPLAAAAPRATLLEVAPFCVSVR